MAPVEWGEGKFKDFPIKCKTFILANSKSSKIFEYPTTLKKLGAHGFPASGHNAPSTKQKSLWNCYITHVKLQFCLG